MHGRKWDRKFVTAVLGFKFFKGERAEMRLLGWWKVVAMVVLGSLTGLGQISPDLEQGLRPYGSYHGGDLDHISLSNGNLFFHANLFSYSQRGGELALPIVLQYNDEYWNFYSTPCQPMSVESGVRPAMAEHTNKLG
jgi:hypothetical protein